MKIENPAALRFIINDDLYLLNSDKIASPAAPVQPGTQPLTEVQTSVVEQPVITLQPVIIKQPPIIVEQPVGVQSQPETPVIDFKYKGVNKNNFLILVHYPSVDFMEDAHLTALENILKRKDLSLDDTAIVNVAKYPGLPKKELLDFFKPQRLLIMGKAALPAGVPAPPPNVVTLIDDVKTLFTFSFSGMMDSNENKKTFWDQMKNL